MKNKANLVRQVPPNGWLNNVKEHMAVDNLVITESVDDGSDAESPRLHVSNHRIARSKSQNSSSGSPELSQRPFVTNERYNPPPRYANVSKDGLPPLPAERPLPERAMTWSGVPMGPRAHTPSLSSSPSAMTMAHSMNPMQGMSQNVMAMNAAVMNGAMMNGALMNGVSVNGVSVNGMAMNGVATDQMTINEMNQMVSVPMVPLSPMMAMNGMMNGQHQQMMHQQPHQFVVNMNCGQFGGHFASNEGMNGMF